MQTFTNVPLLMKNEKLDERVLTNLKMTSKHDLKKKKLEHENFLGKLKNPIKRFTIGIVGRCFSPAAYKSIADHSFNAGSQNDCEVNVKVDFLEKRLSRNPWNPILKGLDAVLVRSGFW